MRKHRFATSTRHWLIIFALLFGVVSMAEAGCNSSELCEDFEDQSVGFFDLDPSYPFIETPNGSIIWGFRADTRPKIVTSTEQGKVLRTFGDSRPNIRPDTTYRASDLVSGSREVSSSMKLRLSGSNNGLHAWTPRVHVEGIAFAGHRVLIRTMLDDMVSFVPENLPAVNFPDGVFLALKQEFSLSTNEVRVYVNNQLIGTKPIADEAGLSLLAERGLDLATSDFGFRIELNFSSLFQESDSFYDLDDVSWKLPINEPAIEPSFTVSQGTTRVGDNVVYTVTAEPDADWTLHLGEIDGRTQIERTVSSDDFNAGDAITVQYYNASDAVNPRLNIDGREIGLESPLLVSCYIDASAYALSTLISDTDCDGDGFTNHDEILSTGAVATIGAGADGLSAFRPDVVVEIDTISLNSDNTAAYYESLFSEVTSPFANNPDGEINLILKASEDFTDAEIQERCSQVGSCVSEVDALSNYRFGFPRGRCTGTWGNSTRRAAFAAAGICESAEETYRKHVKHVFAANDLTLIGLDGSENPPFAVPKDSVMYVPVNNSRLASFKNKYLTRTFMHELGHTMGLGHGGSDGYNYKPNYLSLMNYRFQLLSYSKDAPLDFSHSKLGTLNANAMCEGAGAFCSDGSLTASDGFVDDRYDIVTTRLNILDVSIPTFAGGFAFASKDSTSSEFDWNANGAIDDVAVVYNPPSTAAAPPETEVKRIENQRIKLAGLNGQMMGHDDWTSLQFDPDRAHALLVAGGTSNPGLRFEEATTILTEESDFDHDQDGIPSGRDSCPTIPNSEQADTDNDGVGDACDLCPAIFAREHFDYDGDGIGDACDTVIGSTPLDIPNDEWIQVGTPVATLAQGLGKVLDNALESADYGRTWIVYDYDATIGQYVEVQPGDTLESGVGYWLKQVTGSSVSVKAPVWLRQPEASVSSECHDSRPCFVSQAREIPSARSTNWLMISNPFDRVISVSDVFVGLKQNNTTVTFSPDAEDNDITEFTNGVYVFDESAGRYNFLGPNDSLEPWQAGWFGYRAEEGIAASTYTGASFQP